MKLIDLIASKNAQVFKTAFEERMADKVVSAIEQEKILVAQSFFNLDEESKQNEPKVADNVRAKKMQLHGKIEKIEGNKIHFRHKNGKLYTYYRRMEEEVERKFINVNEEYDLHAERGDTGANKFIKSFKTKAAAAAHVERMEDNDKWPEGHEAILTHKKTGEKHMYVDGWEKLEESIEQIDELEKKTLQSYIRKKSKVDPKNFNVARAAKKIAAKQPTSTLQKKLRTLRNKPPQEHKTYGEYDAIRGELKNRGIHYFGSGSRRY